MVSVVARPKNLALSAEACRVCVPIVGNSMIADAFTKRHGNSVSMMFLRSGQFSIVDEDKELANHCQ